MKISEKIKKRLKLPIKDIANDNISEFIENDENSITMK